MINDNMDFIRVGCATPDVQIGDLSYNTRNIIEAITIAESKDTGLLLLPDLAITGTACGNLFFQKHMYDKQLLCLQEIVNSTSSMNVTIIMGIYELSMNLLYKKMLIIKDGAIQHSIYSNTLSHDTKNFFSIVDDKSQDTIFVDHKSNISIGFNHCCDIQFLTSSTSPLVGQLSYMKNHVKALSGYQNNIILSNNTNGLCTISENGKLLDYKTSFSEDNLLLKDVDLSIVHHDKIMNPNIDISSTEQLTVEPIHGWQGKDLLRDISPTPFKPKKTEDLYQNCLEIFEIQGHALAKRLSHINSGSSVIGISGGLDSTLALLVTAYAHKKLNKDSKEIIGVTMPGFGTTDRTYENALSMMKYLGITIKNISITPAVTQHLKDIEHPLDIQDITYENAQARERTQILMDIANKENGIVIGTGDLSESALGWCTFNGDHMSMFNVNASIPKTVIKYIIRWFIDVKLKLNNNFSLDDQLLASTLEDILDTPISPELLPPDNDGNISQKTEEKVGPYDLHDFFIFYTVRYGTKPLKLVRLAETAFAGKYSHEFILQWLKVFYRRFFTQQFKRNCSPDNPIVGTVGLSLGEWSMPSDVSYASWTSDLEKL